jgi:isoquinoline 1-oxidoreductase beta subunit
MEAWPAAGGGLLLGMIVPALSGAAPLRHPIKNLFLRIDEQGQASVIIPYVRLEPEVLVCAAEMIAAELGLSSDRITIDNRLAGPGAARTIADLCPACELGLALIAAAARSLLTMAAAEIRCMAPRGGVVGRGMVRGARRRATYADLTADAALLPLPAVVFLSSGRSIALRSTRG